MCFPHLAVARNSNGNHKYVFSSMSDVQISDMHLIYNNICMWLRTDTEKKNNSDLMQISAYTCLTIS